MLDEDEGRKTVTVLGRQATCRLSHPRPAAFLIGEEDDDLRGRGRGVQEGADSVGDHIVGLVVGSDHDSMEHGRGTHHCTWVLAHSGNRRGVLLRPEPRPGIGT